MARWQWVVQSAGVFFLPCSLIRRLNKMVWNKHEYFPQLKSRVTNCKKLCLRAWCSFAKRQKIDKLVSIFPINFVLLATVKLKNLSFAENWFRCGKSVFLMRFWSRDLLMNSVWHFVSTFDVARLSGRIALVCFRTLSRSTRKSTRRGTKRKTSSACPWRTETPLRRPSRTQRPNRRRLPPLPGRPRFQSRPRSSSSSSRASTTTTSPLCTKTTDQLFLPTTPMATR